MSPPTKNKQLGLAIVGPYGNIWADRLFKEPKDAVAYLKRHWGSVEIDWPKWRLCQAQQIITPVTLVTVSETYPIDPNE